MEVEKETAMAYQTCRQITHPGFVVCVRQCLNRRQGALMVRLRRRAQIPKPASDTPLKIAESHYPISLLEISRSSPQKALCVTKGKAL